MCIGKRSQCKKFCSYRCKATVPEFNEWQRITCITCKNAMPMKHALGSGLFRSLLASQPQAVSELSSSPWRTLSCNSHVQCRELHTVGERRQCSVFCSRPVRHAKACPYLAVHQLKPQKQAKYVRCSSMPNGRNIILQFDLFERWTRGAAPITHSVWLK